VQKLVLLHGAGRNGKGVFIRICAHIAGDYAKTTPIETFLNEGAPRNASQPTPERAALPGVRMLYTNEPTRARCSIRLHQAGDRRRRHLGARAQQAAIRVRARVQAVDLRQPQAEDQGPDGKHLGAGSSWCRGPRSFRRASET
jgi:hypothetical protein